MTLHPTYVHCSSSASCPGIKSLNRFRYSQYLHSLHLEVHITLRFRCLLFLKLYLRLLLDLHAFEIMQFKDSCLFFFPSPIMASYSAVKCLGALNPSVPSLAIWGEMSLTKLDQHICDQLCLLKNHFPTS